MNKDFFKWMTLVKEQKHRPETKGFFEWMKAIKTGKYIGDLKYKTYNQFLVASLNKATSCKDCKHNCWYCKANHAYIKKKLDGHY